VTRKTLYIYGAILFAVLQFDMFVTFRTRDEALFYAASIAGNILGLALIVDGLIQDRIKIWNFIKRLRRN
jgi:hypothetical protein